MDIKKQVENEISNLEKELEIILLINKKNKINNLDEIEIRGASLSLGALYNGMERILSDILKSEGVLLKDKDSWHKTVLDEASKHSLISAEVLTELKGYLAFRHFIRHAYSFEIDSDTIKVIVRKAPGIIHQFIDEIRKSIL